MSYHIQLCSFKLEQKYPDIMLAYIARTKYTYFLLWKYILTGVSQVQRAEQL